MTEAVATPTTPWQLQMFRRSLKKQQKLAALLQMLGRPAADEQCLLLTCGDNNGALNYYFREHGGCWVWGDVESENLEEMSDFLGEAVHHVPPAAFPFEERRFDLVVAIDVLEHLQDDQPFLREVGRVLRRSGRAIITVPNGDPRLLANRLKWRAGMTPDVYGHTRAGYTVPELRATMERAGLQPVADGGYSRFFTELVEFIINFGYVFVLSRKKQGDKSGATGPTAIAPTTSGELKQHGAAYRLYSLVFPLMRLVSKLDYLLPRGGVGAVIVTGQKGKSWP
jgi:SAM-dependent methyltransferase